MGVQSTSLRRRHCNRLRISSPLSFHSQRLKGKGDCTIVHGLDGRDSRFRSKRLRARREVAGHGTYSVQYGLRDAADSLELLTLGPELEQENQGVAEPAKEALIFTSRSVRTDCWSQSRVSSRYEWAAFVLHEELCLT